MTRFDPRDSRFTRNLTVTVLLATLFLGACGEPSVSEQATAKAQELESTVAGMSSETAAAVFAEDGAHLCAASDSKDHLALVMTPNFFALRKLEVDNDDVELAKAVIDVYCPENRQTFDDYVSGLAVEDSR